MRRLLPALTLISLLTPVSTALPRPSTASTVSRISAGEVSGNTYRNSELGFRYEFPAGWHVSDQPRTPEHQFGWKDDPSGKSDIERCSKTLLFVTMHNEGMRINGFDPMALVIAVDPGCFPPIPFPKSEGDHEASRDIVKQILNHLKTPEVAAKSTSRVHPFTYAGRVIVEFSQSFSIAIHESGGRGLENLLSSVAVTLTGRYWAIWIFVAGNDADLGTLKSSKIFFESQSSQSNQR
jgi:hypothetical protein